jgi:hypothetical protein
MIEWGKNSESALEGEADFASDCTSCCAPPWELVASFREWLSHKQLDRCNTMGCYIDLQREISCGLSTPFRPQVYLRIVQRLSGEPCQRCGLSCMRYVLSYLQKAPPEINRVCLFHISKELSFQ